MRNPVTWFEIIGTDATVLHKFYKDVFDWKLTPPVADMGNYSMLADHKAGEIGAGGGIGGGQEDRGRVSIYVEVDDPQKYLDRATQAGATLLMPVTTITPDTTIAMFRDPAGNTTGILKANPQRPVPRAAARAATAKRGGAKRRTTAKKGGARKATARKRTKRR